MKLPWRSLITALGAGVAARGLFNAWNVQVNHFEIQLENLPTGAEGLRILQISDLHAGALVPDSWIRHVVELANRQHASLVVLTGDFISRRNSYARFTGARIYAHPIDVYAKRVAKELASLKAPLGVYAVPGNHDYAEADYSYLDEILAPAGVRSLVNEVKKLDSGLWLVGVDDLRCGKPEVSRTLQEVPEADAQVVLSHNPRSAWLMRNRNALVLSGHTHGGQIRLFGILRTPVDVLNQHWIHGLFRLNRAKLYISSGSGSIFLPLRYRVPPEITVFTLTSK